MFRNDTYTAKNFISLAKVVDYTQLAKFRLSSVVVFSAAMGFLFSPYPFHLGTFLLLISGGFFITAASNCLNQIFEKDSDKLMLRTQKRPLPDNRLTLAEASAVAFICASTGMILLLQINYLTAFLGFSSLALYAFVYTPLKKITPFSVFIGAIPGALPPAIGYVAATGAIEFPAMLLFTLQFFWQFPHFWAIAWVLDDDYKRAGFKMLPSAGGRDKQTAYQILIYTMCLIPVTALFWWFNFTGISSLIVAGTLTILFFAQAFNLLLKTNEKSASAVMFGSFIYLPLVQLCLVLDKI